MPIIHIQRALRQVGRIRIGAMVATRNGKTAPTKLDRFRLSSPQREPMDKAAELWGGDVVPMTNERSNDQWEVTTNTASLPVVIPPSNHFDAWMELWSAAGCERRCDGERMIVAAGRAADKPCECDAETRECKATTRLFVVLPDIEALGVFRLESHGYYAASELSGAVELCSAATRQGVALPARLELEARTRRTRDENGKPVTRQFAVPVLSVDVGLPQAVAISGQVDPATGEICQPARAEIEAGDPDGYKRARGALRSGVPAEESIRKDRDGSDDLAARSLGTKTPAVFNVPPAAAELPPPAPAAIPAPRTHQAFTEAQGDPQGSPDEQQPLPAPPVDAKPTRDLTDAQRFAIDLGVDDDTRHRLYTIVTGEPNASYGLLDGRQRNQVVRLANQISTGKTTLEQLETRQGS